jgi:hypothetical protein
MRSIRHRPLEMTLDIAISQWFFAVTMRRKARQW